ncbi:ankyrin repeat and zinc finger domain-containing protein 1-like [Impatiens glandulifera]|uniref:ankyrin repeat and zinc finger domain-containing protein 1-like n=1 Tax=Impatiens glandulifera TaxID=253017 RepID=UPI001FB160EA|nr:ankyrin repeat and zinc finger domain-containing protein 1-like [Impatiens glandulifera]
MTDPAIFAAAAADGGKELNELRKRGPESRRRHSLFSLPQDFFDLCRLLHSGTTVPVLDDGVLNGERGIDTINSPINRWSCNTCKEDFESLHDQRSHFKSDIHRFNVKLSISGKDIVKEEEFERLRSDSLLNDFDISNISGSDDERDYASGTGLCIGVKKKLFIRVRTGEIFSIWKCLVMNEDEDFSLVSEKDVIERLKFLVCEPRNNTCLRIVLLASGGHFSGCVFDANLVVAHKTFHRYVIRAKAGGKQSSKDASGKAAAHSAGASLRRYNELALRKEIQEVLAEWNPYFLISCCIFIYAPSDNRQLLFNDEKPYFTCDQRIIRKIPLTVRRPTFKEAQRIYGLLTQINHEIVEESFAINKSGSSSKVNEKNDSCPVPIPHPHPVVENKSKPVSNSITALHEAAKCGNVQKVLELLEQGIDPCIKDERGWTAYMLASVKEVRNVFRRFMSLNPEKWDWHAAKVPSALTMEMEESQAAKQAMKDGKRKAREKELKKLRKAREKKTQVLFIYIFGIPFNKEIGLFGNNFWSWAEATQSGNAVSSQSSNESRLSKEEDLERTQAANREEGAAADERRMMTAAASALVLTLVVGIIRRAVCSKMV